MGVSARIIGQRLDINRLATMGLARLVSHTAPARHAL